VSAETVARALAHAAGLVEPGDIVHAGPTGFGVLRRGSRGVLPCPPLETLARSGHLLLQCVARVESARPPVVAYHFRQVAPRRRHGGCLLADVERPVTAYAVVTPGRPPRVFVHGL
jgi:hypothetical protein